MQDGIRMVNSRHIIPDDFIVQVRFLELIFHIRYWNHNNNNKKTTFATRLKKRSNNANNIHFPYSSSLESQHLQHSQLIHLFAFLITVVVLQVSVGGNIVNSQNIK